MFIPDAIASKGVVVFANTGMMRENIEEQFNFTNRIIAYTTFKNNDFFEKCVVEVREIESLTIAG